MTQCKNTPKLWDQFWQRHLSEDFIRMLQEERASIRWRRLQNLIRSELGGFSGLEVIEIGAGTGTCSALMGELGAHVTILDYSSSALKASQSLFASIRISASHIQCNALHLPHEIQSQFDIAMSFGLAEHFKDEERLQILQSHIDLVRPGGFAIISVPNAWNFPYRLWKWVDEKRGRWPVGEEYPFTRRELHGFCRKAGVVRYRFIGDSIISSFKLAYFLRPTRILSKLLHRPWISDKRHFRIRHERGTPLDAYLSYALVLCAQKRVL